ncbi:DUF4822 domain-containing protein [Nocardia africana]|uniref:DUF4822 domain-containing protein n=1 Tax=Nocardia africana TaxID=134964 RepID=A0ABW6NLG4_9NOCA
MYKLAPALATLAAVGLLAACGDQNGTSANPPAPATSSAPASAGAGSPSAVLASTPWETTSARDAQGRPVARTDSAVANYVGFAYFDPDGTFTMYNLDDTPKMHGDWSISPDGRTRTIVAKNAAGQEQFRRVVEIVTLDDATFTYRVHPGPADRATYYDIVHTPTNHPEPAA